MNMRVVYAQIVKESDKDAPPREVSVVRMLQSTKDANEGYVYKSTFEVLGDLRCNPTNRSVLSPLMLPTSGNS